MAKLLVTGAVGGGIGDCLFDWLREPYFRVVDSLVEDYGARFRIVCQCHCQGVEDIFAHNPSVHEVVVEPWHPPTPEDQVRWNNPIDGWLPIGRHDLLFRAGVDRLRLAAPKLYLSEQDEIWLRKWTTRRPCYCVQPYAGLSDRDGFDPPALARLCAEIFRLRPEASILVLGKNHERGHKYAREECLVDDPRVANLIDQIGIRLAYHLVSRCDGFIGCHSNLIRTAWEYRRRTACVLPSPLMTDHLPNLDPKYTFGFAYPESRKFTFEFATGGPRRFETLDCGLIARWLVEG